MINHETKEIIFEPDYEALHNATLPALTWVLRILLGCAIIFMVYMVDFA